MSVFRLSWWKAWLFVDSHAVSCIWVHSYRYYVPWVRECVRACRLPEQMKLCGRFTKSFKKKKKKEESVGDVSIISFYCTLSTRIYLAVINCFKKSVFVPQMFRGARQSIANSYWKNVRGRTLVCGQQSFQAFCFFFYFSMLFDHAWYVYSVWFLRPH